MYPVHELPMLENDPSRGALRYRGNERKPGPGLGFGGTGVAHVTAIIVSAHDFDMGRITAGDAANGRPGSHSRA